MTKSAKRTKRNPYAKQASVGVIIAHDGRRHYLYASTKQGGYVCVDRDDGSIIAKDPILSRCDRKARLAIIERDTSRAGLIIGRTCVYQSSYTEQTWKVGVISRVSLTNSWGRGGIHRNVYIQGVEDSVRSYRLVSKSKAQSVADALNHLLKVHKDIEKAASAASARYEALVNKLGTGLED